MNNETIIIELLKQILEQLKTANQNLNAIEANTTALT
jgi:hypothetical protein